jgi:protein-disulfide isomerase
MIRRRTLLFSAAAAGLFPVSPARADAALAARLSEPGPLPERVFGSAEARVTVIEYASLTCHHCINFHINTWPAFKAKYVDTGRVRFIIREFPLDPLALAGFMLARCSGEERWYPVVDMLYRSKESWGHARNPAEALLQAMSQTGMSKEQFDGCLANRPLYEQLQAISERASKDFRVNSTPTFFVNGQRHVGALTLEQFDKILEPLLR